MIDSNKELFKTYLAIFAGVVIGFNGVKIIGNEIDKHVLKTCHPTKIVSVNSMFGERLFCRK